MMKNSNPMNNYLKNKKKLFDIRLKMNEARKKNHKEVVEEDKRKCEPKNAEIKRKREEREEKERSKKQKTDPTDQPKPLAQQNEEVEQEKEEEAEEGDDNYYGDPKLMNVTVEEAEEKAKKKERKGLHHLVGMYLIKIRCIILIKNVQKM